MDAIEAQERFVQASLPTAPTTATLTTAGLVTEGDRMTQGRGSRYQGPDFTVATVEQVRPVQLFSRTIPASVNITGTKGERLTGVPVDFACYVVREG